MIKQIKINKFSVNQEFYTISIDMDKNLLHTLKGHNLLVKHYKNWYMINCENLLNIEYFISRIDNSIGMKFRTNCLNVLDEIESRDIKLELLLND